MTKFLARVTTGVTLKPLRVVLTGHPGSGKTTLAVGAPNCVLMPVEEGLGITGATALPAPKSFDDVIGQLIELAKEKHDFKTLVVDAIDGIEPWIFERIVADAKPTKSGPIKTVAEIGFNKGYVEADAYWIRFFKALDYLRAERGMNIVVVSHVATVHYDDPTLGSYFRFEPNLHKRTVPFLTKWADIIGYLDIERTLTEKGSDRRSITTAMASQTRWLHITDQGPFIAKNRFGIAGPLEIPAKGGWTSLRNEVAAAFKKAAGGDTTNSKKSKKKKEAA
jgi:hypothetical protein